MEIVLIFAVSIFFMFVLYKVANILTRNKREAKGKKWLSSKSLEMYIMIEDFMKVPRQFGETCFKEFQSKFYPEHHQLIMSLFDYGLVHEPDLCTYPFKHVKNTGMFTDELKWYIVYNKLIKSKNPLIVTAKALIDTTHYYIMRQYSTVESDINSKYKFTREAAYWLEFHDKSVQHQIHQGILALKNSCNSEDMPAYKGIVTYLLSDE